MSVRKTDWSQAACIGQDPELWFDLGGGEAFCWICPIRQECLIVALERPERFGVWGGHTADDRRRFKFKKNRVRCPACSSLDVDQSVETVEVCRACGLSWRI